MQPETHIANLLYRYADAMDSGDFERAAALFSHARIKMGGDTVIDSIGLLASWLSRVQIHPDGTPGTKHVITNPLIEVSDDGDVASCQSYYTVLQAVDGLPLQVVASGRYRDRFARVDGQWRFTHRDYSLIDLRGDLTSHLIAGPGDPQERGR